MAYAKKCDRCGEFYVEGEKKFTFNGRIISHIRLERDNNSNIGVYDLCDDCTRDLFVFLCNDNILYPKKK